VSVTTSADPPTPDSRMMSARRLALEGAPVGRVRDGDGRRRPAPLLDDLGVDPGQERGHQALGGHRHAAEDERHAVAHAALDLAGEALRVLGATPLGRSPHDGRAVRTDVGDRGNDGRAMVEGHDLGAAGDVDGGGRERGPEVDPEGVAAAGHGCWGSDVVGRRGYRPVRVADRAGAGKARRS
jgi:hypothetical protein